MEISAAPWAHVAWGGLYFLQISYLFSCKIKQLLNEPVIGMLSTLVETCWCLVDSDRDFTVTGRDTSLHRTSLPTL